MTGAMASSRAGVNCPYIRLSHHSRSNSQMSENGPNLSYHNFDPLLSNLSPESTIQALSATDAFATNEIAAHDLLAKGISEASPAERALGIRAAIAAQKLTIWLQEVQAWEWPKGRDAEQGKGFEPPPCDNREAEQKHASTSKTGIEDYGSLPADVVRKYEKRIEEIRDGIDSLDVDELKEHVLNAHVPARSRPSSSGSAKSETSPFSYIQLSDFTAVITATILRALPLLSRLSRLLSVWDVRLLVLRQIPGLLRGLKTVRFKLDESLASLKGQNHFSEKDDPFSRASFRARHNELQADVVHIGRRMDQILDALEGREDSLPEIWIEKLESIETDFSMWVVEAEQRVVETEWKLQKTSTESAENASYRGCDAEELRPAEVSSTTTSTGAIGLYDRTKHEEFSSSQSPTDAADYGPSSSSSFEGVETNFESMNQSLELPVISDPAVPTVNKMNFELKQVSALQKGTSKEAVVIEHDLVRETTPASLAVDDEFASIEKCESQDLSVRAKALVTLPEAQFGESLPSTAIQTHVSNKDVGCADVLDMPSSKGPQNMATQSAYSSNLLDLDNEPTKLQLDMQADGTDNSTDSRESPRQHLESPIRFSKRRPKRLSFESQVERAQGSPVSDMSGDFSEFDCPSLTSSPGTHEPRTALSTGFHLPFETPPASQTNLLSSAIVPPKSDPSPDKQTRRMYGQSTSTQVHRKRNRGVSLPLQRFITDAKTFHHHDRPISLDIETQTATVGSPSESVKHYESHQPLEVSSLQHATNLTPLKEGMARSPRSTAKSMKSAFHAHETPEAGAAFASVDKLGISTAHLHPPSRADEPRLMNRRLMAHASFESLRPKQSRPSTVESKNYSPGLKNVGTGSVASFGAIRQPKNELDKRINSILSTLPVDIQLVNSEEREANARSASSSLPHDFRTRFPFPSPVESPHPMNDRSRSIMMTSEVRRRRHSHAPVPEESCVKVYHLHRSGKSVSQKLFIRSVGENGERVMVRVGGGWADLGEYLREFAIHHGRKKLAETGQVEARVSPASLSRNSTPRPRRSIGSSPLYRRQSVDYPSPVLSVHKTRKPTILSSSLVSTGTEKESGNASLLRMLHGPAGRRSSICSHRSISAASFSSEANGSPTVPLGLAGPLPRSRHVSISPESVAWVDDVLGQALTTTGKSAKYGGPNAKDHDYPLAHKTLYKTRSVSDIGTVGLSKRVALRGLYNRRNPNE